MTLINSENSRSRLVAIKDLDEESLPQICILRTSMSSTIDTTNNNNANQKDSELDSDNRNHADKYSDQFSEGKDHLRPNGPSSQNSEPDDSSGRKEKIIGLGDTDSSDLSDGPQRVEQPQRNDYQNYSEDYSDDYQSNPQMMKKSIDSDGQDSAGFGQGYIDSQQHREIFEDDGNDGFQQYSSNNENRMNQAQDSERFDKDSEGYSMDHHQNQNDEQEDYKYHKQSSQENIRDIGDLMKLDQESQPPEDSEYSEEGQGIKFIQDKNQQNYIQPDSDNYTSEADENEQNGIQFIEDNKNYNMNGAIQGLSESEGDPDDQSDKADEKSEGGLGNIHGISDLPSSNKSSKNVKESSESQKSSDSAKPGYAKKFTGKIMGLDSDEDDSDQKPPKSSVLEEDNPPPPDSDAKYSDEYFDQDEDYLEPENKDYVQELPERSDLEPQSEENYEEDDFINEEALGIEVIEDEEDDDDYSDDNFEKALEDAEPIKRSTASASNRPFSKKYINTPGSSRNLDSSKIDLKYKIQESKEFEEESPRELIDEKKITEDPLQENIKDTLQPSEEVKNTIEVIKKEKKKKKPKEKSQKISTIEKQVVDEKPTKELKKSPLKSKSKEPKKSKDEVSKVEKKKVKDKITKVRNSMQGKLKASPKLKNKPKALVNKKASPESTRLKEQRKKSLMTHIVKPKRRRILKVKSSDKTRKRKSPQNFEVAPTDNQPDSPSESGSSINSQKNKSNLDQLKKDLDQESGKKGFLIRMNIESKNLKKIDKE